eukprot:UN01066
MKIFLMSCSAKSRPFIHTCIDCPSFKSSLETLLTFFLSSSDNATVLLDFMPMISFHKRIVYVFYISFEPNQLSASTHSNDTLFI